MLSLVLTIRKLIQALSVAWKDVEFRNVLILLLGLIVSGTIFYSSIEGWGLLDSLYFSIVTLATVGYGDFAPKTSAGKIFTILYLFVGIGLFVAVAQGLAKGLFKNRNDKHKR
jgi:voltage-gated potassium channel Kch